jgi:hypothetical protein
MNNFLLCNFSLFLLTFDELLRLSVMTTSNIRGKLDNQKQFHFVYIVVLVTLKIISCINIMNIP